MNSVLAFEEAQHVVKTEDSLERALRTFLGWDPAVPLKLAGRLPTPCAGLPSVVILQTYAPAVRKRLASEGYIHQHRFAVLPSRKNPRWLLPITNKIGTFDGFELYKPFSTAARMMKAFVLLVRSTGWDGWVRDEVLLASPTLLPIERLANEITGENQFVFTLSLGTPGAFQKLTVQVMRPDGLMLGYVKMPLTTAAGDRLLNEAEFLQKLSGFPTMRPHVPRLLFGGSWNGNNILFESPVEGATGLACFTNLHKEFLADLHSCSPAVIPGQAVVHRAAQTWEKAAQRMGTKWQELGYEALRTAGQELNGTLVSCGIHHGDFAPWNVRTHRGNLFAFDWESATCGAPNMWDQFHFLVQSECLLKATHAKPIGGDIRKQNRALYLLYLLNSAAQLQHEEAQRETIDYREKQVSRYLSGAATLSEL